MYDMMCRFILFGNRKDDAPWRYDRKMKWICPVPGYDRHFAITELLGFEMINVPLLEDGPDMDMLEKLVANDPYIKGMWCVPKYSNPTGTVYSNEVIRRLAAMETAYPFFRIMCDDAYTLHFLGEEPVGQLNIIKACAEAGNPNRAIMFTSLSKVTFPGAGVAAYASSIANMKYLRELVGIQTIGSDKLNQLRHVNFLKSYGGIIKHMERQAEIMRPKFKICLDILDEQVGDLGILQYTRPKGGYFISIDTLDGCAKRVVQLAGECGVALTPAGATFPYGVDPNDRNIRLAPTFPPVEQLSQAMEVLCTCVKLASLEKILMDKEG